MKNSHGRLWAGLIAVGLVAIFALAPSLALGKKKSKTVRLNTTKQVNQQVPDPAAAPSPYGILTSTITVGKRAKGKLIRDLDVTLQTTGSAAGASDQLFGWITAPNGSTVWILLTLSGQSIGPLTFDDEAGRVLWGAVPPTPCPASNALCSPYVGSARPGQAYYSNPLSFLDGGPARGTYTLTVIDATNGKTSVLNSWGISLTAGKPYKT